LGRTKIKTLSTFTTGTYTLRLFAPEMGVGDMASIGAFYLMTLMNWILSVEEKYSK
jgi:hypothetical protein